MPRVASQPPYGDILTPAQHSHSTPQVQRPPSSNIDNNFLHKVLALHWILSQSPWWQHMRKCVWQIHRYMFQSCLLSVPQYPWSKKESGLWLTAVLPGETFLYTEEPPVPSWAGSQRINYNSQPSHLPHHPLSLSTGLISPANCRDLHLGIYGGVNFQSSTGIKGSLIFLNCRNYWPHLNLIFVVTGNLQDN